MLRKRRAVEFYSGKFQLVQSGNCSSLFLSSSFQLETSGGTSRAAMRKRINFFIVISPGGYEACSERIRLTPRESRDETGRGDGCRESQDRCQGNVLETDFCFLIPRWRSLNTVFIRQNLKNIVFSLRDSLQRRLEEEIPGRRPKRIARIFPSPSKKESTARSCFA